MKTIFIVTTRLQGKGNEKKMAQVAFESIIDAAKWIEAGKRVIREKYLFSINEIKLTPMNEYIE